MRRVLLVLALVACERGGAPTKDLRASKSAAEAVAPTPPAAAPAEAPAEAPEAPAEAPEAAAPAPSAEPPPAAHDELRDGARIPLRAKPITGAIGELTGDREVDILAIVLDGGAPALVLLRGRPDGTFEEGEPRPVDATGVALGDLDGDGDLDALLLDPRGNPTYRVGRNDGAGRLVIGRERRIPGPAGGEMRTAAIADLDGDARLDAVVPVGEHLQVMRGDGRGGFRGGAALTIGHKAHDVALADLDGDGRLDLVATSLAGPGAEAERYGSSGASAWILRGLDRGFDAPKRVGIPRAQGVGIGDLDGDGRPEVVVADQAGVTVIRDPLGEAMTERVLARGDGQVLLADVLARPGIEVLIPSREWRLAVLGGSPLAEVGAGRGGAFVVGIFALPRTNAPHGVDVVLLDAGPLGRDEPAIRVLLGSHGPVAAGG